MLENPWVVSIGGGIIATIIGGIILAAIGRFSYYGGPGPFLTLAALSFFGLLSLIIFAVVFSPQVIPPGGLDFGMEGLDPIIRIFLLIFGESALFLKVFFGIDVFRD